MTEERPHLLIEEPAHTAPRTYPSGGGGGPYPRSDYALHAAKVYREAQTLEPYFRQRSDANATDRRYFRVELPADQSVWTSTGAKLTEALKADIVGAPSKTAGHLSSTGAALNLALAELQRYSGPKNVGRSKFAILEAIGPIPITEKVSARARAILDDAQGDTSMLLSLFPDLSHVERQTIVQAIEQLLRASGGQLLAETEVESGFYIRVSARPKAIAEVAEAFLSVQSVDPVEYTVELSSTPGDVVSPSVAVLPNSTRAVAAIFDSGIEVGCRFIDGSVVDREEPVGPPFSTDHGTFVASRIMYGDTLRDQVAAGQLRPDVRVLSVCTATHDDVGNRKSASTDELMRIIRDTVTRWHQQIRVFNISQNLFPSDLSLDPTVPDDVVSPLAAELDTLARKFDVLFVVTAGNYPRPGAPPPSVAYPDYFPQPDTRVVPPAEAVLALTVGSLAERANQGSLAPQDAPSPFTRRGPGFQRFRKPDLVAHGGNYGMNWQAVEDLATAGIGNHGDHLCWGCGTSYAAPLITRLAARLFEEIPSATPQLVRALLIHFASHSESSSMPDMWQLVGNGRPDPDRVLQSTQWSQAFVHTAAVSHREIRRVEFYVPKAVAERKGRKRVRIRATVAYAPETNRTLKAGYCKSHIRCKLSKRDASGNLKDVTANDGEAVLKDRYAGVARLEKTFSRHVGGGYWELLLEHESRWSLKDQGLPVAAVITVEDPREEKGVDVLAAIRTEVPGRYATQLATPTVLKV